MQKKLFAYMQYLLPQYLISIIMGWVAASRAIGFKNFLIKRFIAHYEVDMSEAKIKDPLAFTTFNEFFIRELDPTLRPIANGETAIACPVDGTIAQLGTIDQQQLLQAKKFYYDLNSLLAGDKELTNTFQGGSFATLYLAPYNYHRVHMPLTGTLEKVIYVPGKLFSVNQTTADYIPNLYARNERLITIFNTEAGPMAVILIGAMIVGSIQTVWMNTPVARSSTVRIETPPQVIYLEKGAELGHFQLGSTVVLLFGKDKVSFAPDLHSAVKFGQLLGNFIKTTP